MNTNLPQTHPSPIPGALVSGVLVLLAGPLMAQTSVFNETEAGTYDWSTGTGWDATPAGGSATVLTIFDPNTTVVPAGTSRTLNNDLGDFTLNQLNLRGTLGSGATVGFTGDKLVFVNDGATAPAINLNALGGAHAVANDIDFSADALFAGNGTSAFTFSGAVSTAGDLVKTGTSSLTLSGAQTLSGAVAVRGGSLTLSGAALTSANVSSVVLGGPETAATAASFTASGATGTTKTIDVTLAAGRSRIATTATGSSGTFILDIGAINREAGSTLTVSVGNNSVITTTTANTHGILGGWATAGGTGRQTGWLTVNESGNIVALGAAGYTDHALVDAGSATIASDAASNIRLTGAAAVGVYGVDLAASGTTDINTILQTYGGGNTTTAPVTTINIGEGNTLRLGQYGGVMIAGAPADNLVWQTAYAKMIFEGGSLTAGGADNTAGEIVFTTPGLVGTSSGDVTSRNYEAVIVNSNITDNGSGKVSVIVDGNRTVRFNGENDYTGGTYVTRGRLISAVTGNLGTGDVHVHAGVTNGAQVYLAGGGVYANDFFIAGTGYGGGTGAALDLRNGSGVSGDITLLADSSVHVEGASILSGRISGDYRLSIIQTWNSSVTLANENSDWTGGLLVTRAGTSSGSQTLVLLGADLDLNGGDLTLNQTGTNGNATMALSGYDLTVNGLNNAGTGVAGTRVVRNSTSAAAAATFTVGSGDGDGSFNGNILNGNASAILNFTKTGTGTQELAGANSYTGATLVEQGTLRVSGTLTGTSGVTVKNGGTFAYANVATLGRAVTVESGGTFNSSGGDVSGLVTLSSGSRLSGTNWNFIAAMFTVGNGVIINPGDGGVGTATASDVVFAGGGVYEFEINAATGMAGTNWDNLNVSLLLELDSSLASDAFTIKLISLDGVTGRPGLLADFDGTLDYSWQIATSSLIDDYASGGGVVLNDLFSVDTSAFQNSFAGSFSVGGDSTSLWLNYAGAPIPEPSAWALLLGGAALAVVLVRRRSRDANSAWCG